MFCEWDHISARKNHSNQVNPLKVHPLTLFSSKHTHIHTYTCAFVERAEIINYHLNMQQNACQIKSFGESDWFLKIICWNEMSPTIEFCISLREKNIFFLHASNEFIWRVPLSISRRKKISIILKLWSKVFWPIDISIDKQFSYGMWK